MVKAKLLRFIIGPVVQNLSVYLYSLTSLTTLPLSFCYPQTLSCHFKLCLSPIAFSFLNSGLVHMLFPQPGALCLFSCLLDLTNKPCFAFRSLLRYSPCLQEACPDTPSLGFMLLMCLPMAGTLFLSWQHLPHCTVTACGSFLLSELRALTLCCFPASNAVPGL